MPLLLKSRDSSTGLTRNQPDIRSEETPMHSPVTFAQVKIAELVPPQVEFLERTHILETGNAVNLITFDDEFPQSRQAR